MQSCNFCCNKKLAKNTVTANLLQVVPPPCFLSFGLSYPLRGRLRPVSDIHIFVRKWSY